MSAERRLDPDYSEPEIDRVTRIIAQVMAARRGESTYTEFPAAVVKWMAAGVMALAVAGVVGLIVMYGQLQRTQEQISALSRDFNDFKRLVEPRYGGRDERTP